MKTALVNGKPMNASEIADYIEHTTGEPIKRETVSERMRKGWTGADLVAPPGRRFATFTTTIDGAVMGPKQLSEWLQEDRGYFVGATTLRARMEKGETGERLLRPSRQRRRVVRERTYGRELVKVGIPGWGVMV